MAQPALTQYFQQRDIPQLALGADVLAPARFGDPAAEHLAVRGGVGVFDFSFMSQIQVHGPQAVTFLERLQPRLVAQLRPGQIIYTFLCRDDGSVFNDATIWRHRDGSFWLFTGRRSDQTHIGNLVEGLDVEIENRSGEYSIIAVQGPTSDRLLERAAVRPEHAVRYFRFASVPIDGDEAWLARIGYSGERGYELLVKAESGSAIWQRLTAAGATQGIAECGFEAANSLRVESGYILFDRELRFRVRPTGLGYGRLAEPRPRDPFVGAQALRQSRGHPEPAYLVGLLPLRRSGGSDWTPDAASLPLGEWPPVAPGRACLTSSCWSPTLSRTLGMGYVAAGDRHPGRSVTLQNGARAQVARLPFYDPPRLRPRI